MSSSTAGNLSVQLNPAHVQVDVASGPVDLTVTIQNLGDVVDQYQVELTGLDTAWYTLPPDVSLFPEDREQVRISLHPNGSAARKGNYPFQVVVRSRGGTAQDTAQGELEIGGAARLRMDVVPPRQRKREGKYKVQISNSGNADVEVSLEARDAQEACEFRFTEGDVLLVPAGGRAEANMRVRPRKRPWVGEDQPYNFAVTARALAGGVEPQTAPGQFTYKPWFRSLGWLKALVFAVVGLAIVAVIGGLLVSAGVTQQFPARTQVAWARVKGTVCSVPAMTNLCGVTALAADPRPNPNCTIGEQFRDFATSQPEMIGQCISDVDYDEFGNAMQFTANGVLLWQRASNTPYFFNQSGLYGFIQGKVCDVRTCPGHP